MKVRTIGMVSLALFGSVAHAQGSYVSASIGQSRFRADTDSFVEHYIVMPATSSDRDDKDSAYKLALGYQFNENFAIEGGYIDLGQQDYTVRSGDARAGLETSAKGWQLDALLILPIDAGVSLFFKGGVTEIELKQKLTSNFGLDASESERKLKPAAGVGLNYDFYAGLAVRAEYERFFNLGDKEGTGFGPRGDNKNGEVDVDLFSIGLSYRF